MNTNIIVAVLIVIVIILGAFFFLSPEEAEAPENGMVGEANSSDENVERQAVQGDCLPGEQDCTDSIVDAPTSENGGGEAPVSVGQSCSGDVSAAQESAKNKGCTSEEAELTCPYDATFSTSAPNGCEISFLENLGWERVLPEESSQSSLETVFYTNNGYSRSSVSINVGDGVMFVNESNRNTWPASNIHPTHTIYPGSAKSKCGTAEETDIFDACGGIVPGDSWSFIFTEVGEWEYHDHLNPSFTGTIVVQ